MKHQRSGEEEAAVVSVSLSLALGADAAAAAGAERKRQRRRAGEAAGGEFVCKTCNRGFPTFQALGGHRTSHLRGRHGLALGLDGQYTATVKQAAAIKKAAAPAASHRCHVCGVGFEMGQALGGHMRRHREEAAAAAASATMMIQAPPVLLELFV